MERRERVLSAPASRYGESTMSSDIRFRRVGENEARVYQDGDYVGDVFRHDDILNRGEVFYVVHLSEDPRGPRQGARAPSRPRGRPPPPRHPPDAVSGDKRHRRCHRRQRERLALNPVARPAAGTAPFIAAAVPRRLQEKKQGGPSVVMSEFFHTCSRQQPCGSTLRVLRSLRSLRPDPRKSKAGREVRRP